MKISSSTAWWGLCAPQEQSSQVFTAVYNVQIQHTTQATMTFQRQDSQSQWFIHDTHRVWNPVATVPIKITIDHIQNIKVEMFSKYRYKCATLFGFEARSHTVGDSFGGWDVYLTDTCVHREASSKAATRLQRCGLSSLICRVELTNIEPAQDEQRALKSAQPKARHSVLKWYFLIRNSLTVAKG